MAWTAPKTYVAGAVLTAAELNTYERDNMLALRSGSVAMTGQANGRFVVATSTTQLSAAKQSYVKVFHEVYS